MRAERYAWCPGNGTRYDLVHTPVGNHTMITWLRMGGSGGISLMFSDFLHYTYLEEKMGVNTADAVGILMFLERMGHAVGYPAGDGYEKCYGEPTLERLSQ